MAATLQTRTFASRAFNSLNVLFLLLFTVTVVYPFWHLLIISFSGTDDIVTMGFHFWLDEWHVEAYRYVFNSNRVGRAYLNSIIRVAMGTTTAIVVTLLAAYPLAKRDLPGRNIITMTFVFTMFFAGGLIPSYLLVRSLGLIDSRWALVLPVALDVFWVIIMRNFMMAINVEMEEAAFMDGASVRTVLVRIIAPLARPAIATIFLWSAVQHWNAWFDAMIYIQDARKTVLQLLLRRLLDRMLTLQELEKFTLQQQIEMKIPTEAAKAAMILVATGPIIMIYPFIQRHFMRGIMIGALKG
jgi:putative aldouronate transport system permease protein